MRISRQALVPLTIGAVLIGACAGCGGGSGSAAAGTAENAATTATPSTQQTTPPSRPPPRVVLKTPQQAVHSYVEGIHAANGTALCNVLDERLQRALIQKLVRARPVEAGASCAQALTDLAAAVTNPGESRPRLPPLQVTVTGDTAVVSYMGLQSHKSRTFKLVKHGGGWLIDRINGTG